MKNTLFIATLATLLSLNQEPQLSKVASVAAIKNTDKLTTGQVSDYVKENFTYPQIRGFNKLFKTGDIIVGFRDIEYTEVPGSLENYRERIIGNEEQRRPKKIKLIESEIQNVKGIKFLITKTKKSDEYFYTFLTQDTNRKAIEGAVSFKEKDKVGAEKLFNDLVTSIKFK
jgi:hypothetical protein